MRQAFILMLLTLVAFACENAYDPPQPYGIGLNRGSNGRAFAAQQSPSRFVIKDVQEEDGKGGATDTGSSLDIPAELNEGTQLCMDQWGNDEAFLEYCVCEDQALDDYESGKCVCDYLVCPAQSPAPEAQSADEIDNCIAIYADITVCGP